jgi:hypothetical protein
MVENCNSVKHVSLNPKPLTYTRVKKTHFFQLTLKYRLNPLPLLFKSLLPGQEDCVFFSGHLNLHAKPETGIPYRENKL